MMPALAGMDIPKEFFAFMSRDALHSDTTWASPVQVAILDAVSCSCVHDSFGLQFLLRKVAIDEEGLELEDPIHSLLPGSARRTRSPEGGPESTTPYFSGSGKMRGSSSPPDGGKANGLKRRSSKTPTGYTR
jgi:hypothetical protein